MRRIRVFDTVLKRWFWSDAPSDGGSQQPFSGFQVYLSDGDGWDSDGGLVPYDGIAFDTDDYWSVVDKKATIPEGKAGLYAVSHFTYMDDVDTLDGVQAIMGEPSSVDDWENGFDHLFVKKLNGNGSPHWEDAITWYGRFADGDNISLSIGWHPFSIPTLNVAQASCLTAILLGNPDA